LKILVGITGGIAAYKSASLIRLLTEAGHEVRVLPTQNALRFIGSATLEALSHNPVDPDLYTQVDEVKHIRLAQEADLIVVAPATAAFLARYASGLADDLLLNVLLATQARVFLAPAMHTEMWLNQATQENLQKLKSRGVTVIDPESGRLTGNDTGVGRMAEPETIAEYILSSTIEKPLAGKRIIVASGSTREPIDAVRFIGNRSSGHQGLAIANEAKRRGAEVLLINCNMSVLIPADLKQIAVETTAELLKVLETEVGNYDYLFMPVAVSDYRAEQVETRKLSRKDQPEITLKLLSNPDVVSEIAKSRKSLGSQLKIVAFAAELASGKTLGQLAQNKRESKDVDFVVANDVSNGKVFGSPDNSVIIVGPSKALSFEGTKEQVASFILDSTT